MVRKMEVKKMEKIEVRERRWSRREGEEGGQ
jgi:hypothetical protein